MWTGILPRVVPNPCQVTNAPARSTYVDGGGDEESDEVGQDADERRRLGP